MKKKIAIIVGVVILSLGIGTTFYVRKANSIKKQLKSINEKMESYTLVGNLKMLDGEDVREYTVDVSFTKYENQDYFKVSLHDKLSNQDQIIIRNKEGVFVVTPALNRAFQFKSEWPYNSLKPYIYQSLLKMFESDYKKEKSKDGNLITGSVSYATNPNATKQEVKFNKDLHPMYVNVLSDEDIELIQLDVTEFKMNPKIDMSTFDVYHYIENKPNETTPDNPNPTSSIDDLPLYPMEVMGSVLASEEELEINGVINHVLQFNGDKNFTLVESNTEVSSNFVVEQQSGELVDLIGSFGIYKDNELQVFDSSMVCKIYSNDLKLNEMISIINSMQQAVLK